MFGPGEQAFTSPTFLNKSVTAVMQNSDSVSTAHYTAGEKFQTRITRTGHPLTRALMPGKCKKGLWSLFGNHVP